MRREVTFDVEGIAVEYDVKKKLSSHARNIYQLPSFDLSGIDCDSYILPRGTKLNKVFRRVLGERHGLTRKQIDEHWALFCTRVADLYTKPMTLKAIWADEETIATGEYDNRSSCFRSGSNNYICKVFIQKCIRGRVCCIERIDGEYGDMNPDSRPRGRVLVYFAGGRKVYMFNEYYRNNMIQNHHFFAQSIGQLVGIPWARVKRMPDKYPIVPTFMNEKVWMMKAEKTFDHDMEVKWPCPNCGKQVHEEEYYYNKITETTRKLGCTKHCAHEFGKPPPRCRGCSRELREAEDRNRLEGRQGDNHWFCAACWEIKTQVCPHCSERATTWEFRQTVDTKELDDHPGICAPCMRHLKEIGHGCQRCQNVYISPPEMKLTADHVRACPECWQSMHPCLGCDQVYSADIGAVCSACLERFVHVTPYTMLSDRAKYIMNTIRWAPNSFFMPTHKVAFHFNADEKPGELLKPLEPPKIFPRSFAVGSDGRRTGSISDAQFAWRDGMRINDHLLTSAETKLLYAQLMAELTPVLEDDMEPDYIHDPPISIGPLQPELGGEVDGQPE